MAWAMSDLSRRKALGLLGACSLAALAVTGCGGSSHHATHPETTAVAVTSAPASTSTTAPAPAPAARLRIIAPRPGATTSQTLMVRLSLTGGGAPGAHLFRYVLDGTLVRLGSARLTFHGLAFGRHHLSVMLASLRSVRATRSFIVPQPAAAQAPSASQATTSSASSSAIAPAAAAPPSAATTPAPAPTPAPSPTSGIPQGPNAGDADGDNRGGTSDGDGNI
jgi:hypothetical protein